jgi:aquaporin Z
MKRYVSEFIATFTLLLAILEAIVITAENSHGLLIVSAVAGICVTILIYGFRKHSGAHMNPAISTAMWLDNQLTTRVYFGYFSAQLLGSASAAFVIELAHGDGVYVMGMTVPSLVEWQAWILEVILTFVLILAIFRCTDSARPKLDRFLAPVVGLIVFLEIYFAGPYSGASMNPARSFGPALVEGRSEFHYLYFSAPLFGAAVARYFDLIFRKKSKVANGAND